MEDIILLRMETRYQEFARQVIIAPIVPFSRETRAKSMCGHSGYTFVLCFSMNISHRDKARNYRVHR